jgi:hypothetical protein
MDKTEERRKFLKKAGKAALTAPAVALLLSAESKQAHAITAFSGTQDSFAQAPLPKSGIKSA